MNKEFFIKACMNNFDIASKYPDSPENVSFLNKMGYVKGMINEEFEKLVEAKYEQIKKENEEYEYKIKYLNGLTDSGFFRCNCWHDCHPCDCKDPTDPEENEECEEYTETENNG